MELSEFINRDRLVETFKELICINSPSFQEREISSVLAAKLRAAGCDVEMQEYGRSFNLTAFSKGDIPDVLPVMLSAHMDTIEPTEGITFSIAEGLIRTTGPTVLGADDKSALAQIIEAMTVIHERGLSHGDIEIVLSSAEERELAGARNLDFERLRSRHALILDSEGEVGKIVTAAPTHISYEMAVIGRSAHAGIEPEKGINAIRVASMIISEVPDGRIDAVTTANIGIIQGGTATNVVPKDVLVRGEVRSHDAATLEETKRKIFGTAKMIAERNHAEVRITEEEEYRSFSIGPEEPFLKFLERVFSDCGLRPVYAITGGGSDANVFHRHGIMAVNISTGMQNVHSTGEYIEIRDLVKGCLVTLKAVTEFRRFMENQETISSPRDNPPSPRHATPP
jgi:tripeptide aminopeptidase